MRSLRLRVFVGVEKESSGTVSANLNTPRFEFDGSVGAGAAVEGFLRFERGCSSCSMTRASRGVGC